MKVFTDYLWFNTKKRQEFVRITDEVSAIVKKSGIQDGMVLVSAMHITAGVYVNDWEDGLIEDFQVWLEKLAPAGMPYKHHQTGEDNADAHLKRTHHGAPGHRADHRRRARSRAVGAGLLRRVRRQAEEAGGREGDGGVTALGPRVSESTGLALGQVESRATSGTECSAEPERPEPGTRTEPQTERGPGD